MKKLLNWIKNHQTVSFFVITFTITWGLGFSYGAVIKDGQFILSPLVFVATCGPGLAGIVVSTIINFESKHDSTKAFWITFLIAWPITALVGILFSIFINQTNVSLAVIILYLLCAIPVAFIISSSKSNIPSVRNYVKSLIAFRNNWPWALAASFMLSASIYFAVNLNSFLSEQATNNIPERNFPLIGLIVIKFLYQLFFFNATGEEVGWRGFALPRLQSQVSPLGSAVIIGMFWAPWHFFLWQAEGRMVFTLSFWSTYLVGHILFSILLTWFYNRSNGSILVVGIAHASVNTASAFFSLQNLKVLNLTWAIIALLLILNDRMWSKLPTDHSAVYTLSKIST